MGAKRIKGFFVKSLLLYLINPWMISTVFVFGLDLDPCHYPHSKKDQSKYAGQMRVQGTKCEVNGKLYIIYTRPPLENNKIMSQ